MSVSVVRPRLHMSKNISYMVINDIHLGHRKVKTTDMIYGLDKFILDNKKTINRMDIIFIAGDIFDRLLSSNSDEYIEIIEWLTRLSKYCGNNKIKLRILEGTPSHDWKQARVLGKIIVESNIDVDYKYMDRLSLEVMDDLGLSIIYVPDEWNDDPLDTLLEAKQLLLDNNLNKVDLAIMHGQFPHQIPGIELDSSHNPDEWISMVNYFIHIGHIHKKSVLDKIIAGGSFDRISHGEEEDKGVVFGFISASGNAKFIHVENKNATIFKTLDVKSNNVSEIIDMVTKLRSKYKKHIYVRLDMLSTNSARSAFKLIASKVGDVTLTLKPIKKSNTTDADVLSISNVKVSYLSIDESNIYRLMSDEMKKYNLSDKDRHIFDKELRGVM